jgi:Ser/Thr protein kinase RdoA (MazF antagonist)
MRKLLHSCSISCSSTRRSPEPYAYSVGRADKDESPRDTAGSDLVSDDLLWSRKADRDRFFSVLSDSYDFEFDENQIDYPDSFSNTSRKIILCEMRAKKKFLLKEKPIYCSEQKRRDYAASFQNYLAARLDFVPPIIQTTNGASFINISDRFYFLTPYVKGRIYSGSYEDSQVIAESLARIHKLSMSFTGVSREHSVYHDNLLWISLAEKLECRDRQKLKRLLRRLLNINEYFRPPESLRLGAIHGDLSVFNVVFVNGNAGGVAAINDFDNASTGSLLQDLAECLLSSCGIYYYANTSRFNIPIQQGIDWERLKVMMRAYLSIYDQLLPDLDYLANAIILTWVELMCLGLIRGDFEPQDVLQTLDFPARVAKNLWHELRTLGL